MDYTIQINGFHGTNKVASELICEKRRYEANEREDHWLGQGIYFFREDPEQAKSWALTQVDTGEVAVVLSTVIKVDSNSFLNLNTRTDIFTFRDITKTIEKQVKINGIAVKEDGSNHKIRCFVMDLLPKYIKVIQNSFINKQPNIITTNSFMQSVGIEMHGIQVCVRDQNVIEKDSIKVFQEEKKNARKRSAPFKHKKSNGRKRSRVDFENKN